MASFARIDELKKKFDENPRRYFAPLANEFRKVGDIDQAIMICEEFLPQQPGHMSGHIVYGQALFEAGRFAESKTVFETALTLDPENLIALRHLGDIARGQGDIESAQHWYERVLEADPRNEEIQGLLSSLSDAGAPSAPISSPVSTQELLVPRTLAPAPTSAPTAPPPSPAPTVSEQRFAPPPPPPLPLTPPPRPPAPTPEPLDIELGDLTIPAASPAPAPVAPTTPLPPPFPASLENLEPMSTAEMNAFPAIRAEGLEASEFVPPERPVERDAQLESGEFTPPPSGVAPLPGLEATSADTETAAQPVRDLPPLDLDDGLTLPPQGDMVVEQASPTADLPMIEDVLSPATSTAQPPELPTELPPPVIAAEAELIAAATASPASAGVREAEPIAAEIPQERERRVTPVAPFLTETMAELYLKQGFREQAYDVYRQLLAASPDNARLREKVAELEPRDRAPAEAGPNVRDFFARLAARRPGTRSAAAAPPTADDFAALTPPPPPEPVPVPAGATGAVAPAVERAARLQTPAGSIDALFESRPVGTSEDSAASALAQAFGGTPEPAVPPPLSGRPARAAAGELSLESVFRDGSARPPRSQGFSFDQFFSETAAAPAPDASAPPNHAEAESSPSAEPADRGADDIEQFNSWLQGLKHR